MFDFRVEEMLELEDLLEDPATQMPADKMEEIGLALTVCDELIDDALAEIEKLQAHIEVELRETLHQLQQARLLRRSYIEQLRAIYPMLGGLSVFYVPPQPAQATISAD